MGGEGRMKDWKESLVLLNPAVAVKDAETGTVWFRVTAAA